MSDLVPSKSGADKAGDRLKRFVREGGDLRTVDASHELHRDVLTAQHWRAQFSGTLTGVSMGVRSMSRTCTVHAEVGQRHKRLERIVQKLARPKTTRLSVMQDIAGVRAVVDNLSDLRRLETHIRTVWADDKAHTSGQVIDDDDYIDSPRESGYRALHLIVLYNGRPAELQLRTSGQHVWAEAVESVSRLIGEELKAGPMPDRLQEYFIAVSDELRRVDAGEKLEFAMSIPLEEWGVSRVLTISSE